MGGKVTDPTALWLRGTLGLSSGIALSDTVEGDRRDGESCCTSSALPSTDIERRNFDDCGGGSKGPGAADEGRDAGMNSCLVDVSIVYEGEWRNAPTCKSLGCGGDNERLCQRAACLQNTQQRSIGGVVEPGQL